MVNDMANGKAIDTFSDYMNDETRVSPAERERINFEISLIGKMIEAREEKGLSQRELAEISGVKQPAIARLESLKATPQIDTLFKVLHPLGYTIEIVPLGSKQANI
jgi:DNA-binding XRE family transcriptional regulator